VLLRGPEHRISTPVAQALCARPRYARITLTCWLTLEEGNCKSLKNRISELRKQRSWSLQRLSLESGIPVNTLWRMERGYGIALRNAFKVADAFGLTVYEVWDIRLREQARPHARTFPGNAVRELRLNRGWGLKDLVKSSGVSKTTLSEIERGHTPTLKNAIRIASAFGVSVYAIWNASRDIEPEP